MAYPVRTMNAIAGVVVLCVKLFLCLSSFSPLSNGFTLISPPHGRVRSFSSLSLSQVRLVGRVEVNGLICSTSFSIDRRLTKDRGSPKTRLQGLFGLGGPELAIITVVVGLVLGPDKLASVAKGAGRMAGELKEVPKEFEAGIMEGELLASKEEKKP